VDSATLRRGNASANTVWGNEASVLVGDFLFSKSFSLMVEDGDLKVLKVLSGATTKIAEGEVLQLICTSDLEMTEERYIEVVKGKTAILISAASQAGAILGKASPEQEAALADFGMELGIAFQIMDDLLDYTSSEEEFGKNIGHDLEEGKITLPLIHTLQNCTPAERDLIAEAVNSDVLDENDIRAVFDLVHTYDGINYAAGRAASYVAQCKSRLASFADSQVRKALLDLADYVVSRNS